MQRKCSKGQQILALELKQKWPQISLVKPKQNELEQHSITAKREEKTVLLSTMCYECRITITISETS
jgi:hypothetical protein